MIRILLLLMAFMIPAPAGAVPTARGSPAKLLQGDRPESGRLAARAKKRRPARGKRRVKIRNPPPPKRSESGAGPALSVGLFSLYLPQPAVGLNWYGARWSASLDAGFMMLPLDRIHASSTWTGIAARWFFTPVWFAGLSYGQRSFSIGTYEEIEETGVAVTRVDWSHEVSQTVLAPKAGMEGGAGGSLRWSLAFGALIPGPTSISTSGDPASVPNMPADLYEARRAEESDDVQKVTASTTPLLEFRIIMPL